MTDYISRDAAIAETRKPRLTDAELRRRLAQLAAADVRPVVHGKWKKSYADHEAFEAFGERPFFRYCSNCNEVTVHPYNFCPHCGADMRGNTNG